MGNYQYGYAPPPQYQQHPQQFYGGVPPSNEYLEQRRVSMPLNPYSVPLEQPVYQEKPQQYRSNSMANVMNFNQFKGNSNTMSSNIPPPGLQKMPVQEHAPKRSYSGTEMPNASTEINQLTGDFSKMKLSKKGALGATGEKSVHSNSTIKEEEFDSDRDAIEHDSDSSNKQMSVHNQQTSQYVFGSQVNQNSLLDDEMIRNQRRRESHQINTTMMEDKKLLKSPMKSSSIAWVPKPKDTRTSSMPNIFQPLGGKEKFPQSDNRQYYQFNAQGGHPGMMGYAPPPVIGANSAQNRNNMPNMGGMDSLNPHGMPDYDYEERRNSGTTGGCSNPGRGGKNNKNQNRSLKKGGNQYNNKSRRTSAANITIPTNDKNVMDYKGQLVAFAKNQQGSKYLQRALAKASPDVLEFIVVEVGDNLHELMVDSYGNYFCQKLLQS